MTGVRVLVVDDNPIVREVLRDYLDTASDVVVVGEAGDGLQAVTLARRLRPAVTLLDHRMPVADGLSVLGELGRYSSVLVLTSDRDPELIGRMLRGGARGYLVHGEFDPPELHRAVIAVAGGHGWLSPVAAAVATATVRDQVTREREHLARAERHRRARARYGLTPREEEAWNCSPRA